MKKLKKQISVITFTRLLKLNTYIICSSNLLSIKKKSFISNYIFKTLYFNLFPTNFLNSTVVESNLHGFINNFLVFSKFATQKKINVYYNNLELVDKFKISFIKYKNLYFINDYSTFLKYFNVYSFVKELNSLLLNYVSFLGLIIKKVIKI